jgi:hypothetical protein
MGVKTGVEGVRQGGGSDESEGGSQEQESIESQRIMY